MIQFGKGKTLLQLINRKKFDELSEKWGVDTRVRSLSSWQMTCTHIMAFVLRLKTLREVEETLSVPRSTFSDANGNRPAGFFEDLCEVVLIEILGATKGRKIKKALKAIDSTECSVHGSVSRLPLWRTGKKSWKKATAKIHVVWNVGGSWIEDFRITGKGTADNIAGHWFKISSGSTYVFDRGYTDIEFWWRIVSHKAHFVTRLKKYPVYERLLKQVLAANPKGVGVLWEGDWRPTQSLRSKHKQLPEDLTFRHIIYKDPDSKRVFHFITSDRKSEAQTIANIYRKRWAVELLFRWLKGNLNIRYLATKDPNAIRIQLAISVLIQLLICPSKLMSRWKGTPSEYLRAVRASLAKKTLTGSGLPKYVRWKPLPHGHIKAVPL